MEKSEEYLKIVEDCISAGLSEWEEDFLEEIFDTLMAEDSLTEQQIFKLEQIDERVN